MFKKGLISLGLIGAALQANAEFVVGAQLGTYEATQAEADLTITTAMVSGGYQFDINENFSLTPELRIGAGLDKSTETETFYEGNLTAEVEGTFEVTSVASIELRAQYRFEQGFYLFATPKYTAIDYDLSYQFKIRHLGNLVDSGTESESFNKRRLGAGVGFGYSFNDLISVEFNHEIYEKDGDKDEFQPGARFSTLGLRFNF